MFMKRKGKSALLLGLFTAGITLGACGAGKEEVTLWNPFTGADGEFFQKIVDEYNETDPDIKVKNVTVPEMYTKINTVMNSKKDKDIPDLTVIHVERVELFESQELLNSMEKIMENQPDINESNYIDSAWEGGEVDGERYTVPLDVHSSPMYYNIDLVEKYAPDVLDDGVVTIDEIREITPKAKADGIITYPINVEHWTSMSFTTAQGGSIEKDGLPNLNTPEMKKSLETLKAFVDEGTAQEDGDDPVQLFQSGKSVFFQGGTWDVSGHNEIDGLNWGMTNTPVFTPDIISNWTSSHQFALLKKERSEEKLIGIGEFLEFARENADVWAESGQNVASRAVFEAESYKKYPQSFLVNEQRELDSLTIYDFKNNGLTMDSLSPYVRDMVYGRLDISEGLEKAQKEADDKIKEGN